MKEIVPALYLRLRPYKIPLLALVMMIGAACAVWSSHLVVREDIRTMLPEAPARIARDFSLLRETPFAQQLIVTISHPGSDPTIAATVFADALKSDTIPDVVTGPSGALPLDFLVDLCDFAPALFDTDDLAAIEKGLSSEHIRRALQNDFRTLLSPEGIAQRTLIAKDPLEFRKRLLEKLAGSVNFSHVRLHHGKFASPDGQHALVLARARGSMSDSAEAARVMERYEHAVQALPDGAYAALAGAHRHTDANTKAIKQDIAIVIPVSLVLLGVLFVVFMPTWQSLLVFLLPTLAISLAGILVSLFYGSLSGIVMGLGGMLMGITVDYGIYVFHAMRNTSGNAKDNLAEVARPVMLGAATSVIGFAALLTSDIPGIRQLAAFAITGMILALVLSLTILPHFIAPPSKTVARTGKGVWPARRIRLGTGKPHPFFYGLWIVCAGSMFFVTMNLSLDGDLRALAHTPDSVRQDEELTRSVWGGMRDMAVVFASGTSLEEALQTNDAVWHRLSENSMRDNAVSIAPLLPSQLTQTLRMAAWSAFWHAHGLDTVAAVEHERAPLRFSATAFAPFAQWLAAPPVPFTPDALKRLMGDDVLALLSRQDSGGVNVLTLVPDQPSYTALFASEEGRMHLVSGSGFRELMSETMKRDTLRFGTLALCGIVIAVFVFMRDLSRTMQALFPMIFGLAAIALTFFLTGMQITLFHIVAMPLVIGLSVDYGIFITCHPQTNEQTNNPTNEQANGQNNIARRSILLAALTTLSGFLPLVFARHPALSSIGLTLSVGIAAALVAVLVLLPLFERKTP